MLARKNSATIPTTVMASCIISLLRPKFSTLPRMVSILISDKKEEAPKSMGSIRFIMFAIALMGFLL